MDQKKQKHYVLMAGRVTHNLMKVDVINVVLGGRSRIQKKKLKKHGTGGLAMNEFRGKTVYSERWVYGFYARLDNDHYILTVDRALVETDHNLYENKFVYNSVIPKTVGQSTGLRDKNGKMIYEGDRVLKSRGVGYSSKNYPSFADKTERKTQFIVEWDNDICGYQNLAKPRDFNFFHEYEIIGNIHDQEVEG